MEMWKEQFSEEEKCGPKRGVVPGQEHTNMEMWKEQVLEEEKKLS